MRTYPIPEPETGRRCDAKFWLAQLRTAHYRMNLYRGLPYLYAENLSAYNKAFNVLWGMGYTSRQLIQYVDPTIFDYEVKS